MKQLLILSTLVFGYCLAMSITCDNNYSCTVSQLTAYKLPHLELFPFHNISILTLRDVNVLVLVVSSLHPVVHQLNLERCQIGKIILPSNCSLDHLMLDKTIGSIEVYQDMRLRYLSVTKSDITALLPALTNLKALETMRLWKMRLPTFDFDVLHDKEKLFVIELNYDHIERLHFSQNRTCCQNLTEIDLSFNRLITADLSLISRLRALKRLRFSSNQITELYGSLELPLLLELDLSRNRIRNVDLCHWDLQSLMELNLNNNQIDRMPNCIERLTKLMNIRIADNLLVELDFAPFAKLGLLFTDFSRNRIEVVQNHHILSQEVCLVVLGNPISNSTDVCIGRDLN